MTKQELNLFQFTAIHMAKPSARPAKIVWRYMVQLHPLSNPLHHVPNDVLRDSLAPRRPMPANGAEDSTRTHLCQISPSIDCILDPSRHRNSADMTAFADQVHNGPMSLPNLSIFNCQRRELGAAQYQVMNCSIANL
jgi:hypothetical protein